MRPDRLRVLQVADVVNRDDFIDTIVRFADPRRFAMMVCTFRRDGHIARAEYPSDIPYEELRVRGRIGYPAAIGRLARLARRWRADLIHAHHLEPALVGLAAAWLAGIPCVVGRHYHDELYLLTQGIRRVGWLGVERLVQTGARQIIVPSERVRELLVERQRVRPDRVEVIPYGFDFSSEKFQPLDSSARQALRSSIAGEPAFLVGNVGRHHWLKGQAWLLEAFAQLHRTHPHSRLVLIGDGPERSRLEALAGRLGVLDETHVLGWRQDVPAWLRALDVIVHPTLHEAMSQLMVETMAAGTPLVITPVAGTEGCVEHGRTGFVVPLRDAETLANQLRWIADHPEEAQHVALAGQRHVTERFAIQRLIGLYEACYARCVSASAACGEVSPVPERFTAGAAVRQD